MQENNNAIPHWLQIISYVINLFALIKVVYDIRDKRKTTDSQNNSTDISAMKLTDAMIKEWMKEANGAMRAVNRAERRISKFKIALEESLDIIQELKPEGYKEFIAHAQALLKTDDDIDS